jgi:LysM repeat protein
MGQLEKYGLYVMCLVIFLILGVSLWDVGDPPTSSKQTPALTEVANQPSTRPPAAGDLAMIDDLFKPTPRENKASVNPAAKPAAGTTQRSDTGTTEAGGDKATPPSPEKPPAADSKRPVHKVRDGETLESIARSKLGSGALHVEIARLNPGVKPTLLQRGQEIVLPSAQDLAQRKPAARDAGNAPAPLGSSDRLYTIKKGDTFERIAIAQLGDRNRVDELRALNPTVEDTKLREGKSLKLPKK